MSELIKENELKQTVSKSTREIILGFIDKYYLLLSLCIAVLVTKFNYNGETMSGLLPNYLDMKRLILSGFDLSSVPQCTPTFPMWGYSWVLILTENKLLILAFQQAAALFVLGYSIRFIEKSVPILADSVLVFKVLMLITIPWYAFHSLLWANSPAISLFIPAFFLAYSFFHHDSIEYKTIILSGFIFGLALNFRSDYFMLPFGFAVIAFMVTGFTRKNLIKAGVWIFTIFLTLVPWMLYTRHVTGRYLITSTNSGHVFFIGLGNLPDNKWNITQYDGDPLMHSIVEEKFGKGASTLSYEADCLLKQ